MENINLDLSEDEDEGEDKDGPSIKEIRRDLIVYLIKNYGRLKTKDVARVLGLSTRAVRRNLKELEEMGEIESIQIGRSYIWASTEEESTKHMYY
ncbi:MAG: winged helix-turn-helix transcriptional regulator [Hadesarchaea archaeon]|nr:winged helix-turn-helix transcriptional regulator [Hadesarchaea archaeon]